MNLSLVGNEEHQKVMAARHQLNLANSNIVEIDSFMVENAPKLVRLQDSIRMCNKKKVRKEKHLFVLANKIIYFFGNEFPVYHCIFLF